VYVSFGSVVVLSKEQTEEIALGVKVSGHSFIWVIRPSSSKEEINSEENLPESFLTETSWQGLVVPWCPQLQVLSHASVGALITHCGWNSTLESLSFGVPLLAVPQWSDQTTNSLYIAEKWKTGLRVNKRSADGLVGKEDVEKCIKMVMESELGVELRENALRWKKLSREAMGEAGSSNENIEEFVEDIVSRASSMSLSG
jgi:pathogen-inducible salicylic acid glucosyltransferase